MSIKVVKIEEVTLGAFVILPRLWLSHPFLLNKFLVTTEAQLDTLQDCGLTEVQVDISRSRFDNSDRGFSDEAIPNPPMDAKTEARSLRNVLYQPIRRPQSRATAIYTQASVMMNSLLMNPTSESIGEVKEAVGEMVNMVLEDDDTSSYLVRVSSHDPSTYTHSLNVGIYGMMLAKKIYKTSIKHDLKELVAGLFLHDLGKININLKIIQKSSKLLPEEWDIIRNHPIEGIRILSETGHMTDICSIIIMQHHEREDGSGYPFGLKGEEIHDYARICCIADIYDALTSQRSYKQPIPVFKALELMRDEMPTCFNRDLFEAFVMMLAPKRAVA
jgi:HD-GYP domain-containing protein (c-di-GMP phosphodiesterase class II)